MTDHLDELSVTLEKNNIDKIAIVDDAYDAFDPEAVSDEGKRAFRRAITDLQDIILEADQGVDKVADARQKIDALESILGRTANEVLADLNDGARLSDMWKAFTSSDIDEISSEMLRPMFGEEGADRAAKLRPLRKIKELIEGGTKAKVFEFDSATSANDVAGFDMVFLDFYLSSDVPNTIGDNGNVRLQTEAKERSIKFLTDLVNNSGDEVPLVMLISSEAGANDLPMFRKKANMLASKISFLPKKYMVNDQLRAQHTILALAKYRSQGDALWKLMRGWQDVVQKASEDVIVSLRELDLHDFSYLQEHRLAEEKTPLSQYLIWLLSGKLTDLVERKMSTTDAAKLAAKMTIPQAIPGRIGPTRAITDLYSSLTTSQVPVAEGDFQPKTWSGDIYLDTKTHNKVFGLNAAIRRRQKALPQVLAVLTPACDLVPGRNNRDDKLKTVTMIGGELKPLDETMEPSSYLLMLNDKPYVVEWNFKWPVTMTLDAMGPKSSMAERYQWVGRLREMYHADLQHRLMRDVGRVGLPVAPTMSEPVGVRIMVRTGGSDTSWATVFEQNSEERVAWTFPAMNKTRAYCLREDVIWSVRATVRDKFSGTDKFSIRLREKLDLLNVIGELQHPIAFKNDVKKNNFIKYHRVKNISEITKDSFDGPLMVIFAKDAPPRKGEPSTAELLGQKALEAAVDPVLTTDAAA